MKNIKGLIQICISEVELDINEVSRHVDMWYLDYKADEKIRIRTIDRHLIQRILLINIKTGLIAILNSLIKYEEHSRELEDG